MNKSLSYVKLSLELCVVSTFWLGSDTFGTSSLYILPTAITSYELERPALKMRILWCRLALENPFPVLSLCKLNHISVCFIQTSTKNTCKQLIPFRESHVFFWSDPRCFGPLGKFQHNLEISIKTARVSRLSVSCDYGSSKEGFFQFSCVDFS